MMRMVAALPLLLLASCPPDRVTPVTVPDAPDLETAAIARGLVRDSRDVSPTGLYARDTDRLCVVPDGGAYRVGAYVDYGDGIACAGSGRATRSGSAMRVALGEGNCRFDAIFDGDRIEFPARLPEACDAMCGRSASFAALRVERLSESVSEAAAMRNPDGVTPCATR